MSRRAGIVLALAIAGFAAVTTAVGMASGAPPEFLVLDGVGGMTFLLSGLAAVWLRPRSPAGPMLMVCAALWWVGSYAPTGQPALTHLGFSFERYYDLVLAALLLLLSGGIGRAGRAVLVALAAAMAVRTVSRLFLQDPALLADCPGCPPNPFALWPNQAVFEATEVASNLAIALLVALVGAIAVWRLLGSGPVARRARWPILLAGMVAMLGAAFDAAEYAWSTATGTFLLELPEPWAFVFEWATFGARALVPLGFLVAVLRMRGQAGPLGSLAERLQRPGTSGTIGDALRRALGDPSLELLRPGGAGSWLNERGNEIALPQSDQRRTVSLVGLPDAPTAAIVHEPALRDQPELLDGVVRVLGLALENERLEAEVRDQLQQVTESRTRIVEAAEAERQRLERDLHDGAQQRLIAVMLALQQARATVGESSAPSALHDQLDAATTEMNHAIRELRELARGIHPAILEEEGLRAAVAGLARRASLPVQVNIELDGRLPRLVESTAYFTIAEALTNTQRHAQAREAQVRVSRNGDMVEVEVRDDGEGGANASRGTGLRGLADRITALGGQLGVESTPGGGTTVRATIPVP